MYICTFVGCVLDGIGGGLLVIQGRDSAASESGIVSNAGFL